MYDLPIAVWMIWLHDAIGDLAEDAIDVACCRVGVLAG
jgi:hypothetical protein